MKMARMIKIFSVICFYVFISTTTWAWWSEPEGSGIHSTHYNITNDAVNLISSDYPDVTTKYGDDIKDWTSGHVDDGRAHDEFDPYQNYGPIALWWDYAQDEYQKSNFADGDWSAYYYIALMAHLTEDMAVPAHVYNIDHRSWGDNMESMVGDPILGVYSPTIIGIVGATLPISNYTAMQGYTLNATSISYWRQYWDYGRYGGSGGTDIFPDLWSHAGEAEKYITSRLLGAAVDYTAGALIVASKKLPPVIKETTIEGGKSEQGAEWFVAGNNVKLTFKYYENRSAGVEINIFCNDKLIKHEDLAGGAYSVIPDANTYNITFPSPFPPGDPGRAYDVNVKVSIKDGDGNEAIAHTSFKSYVFYTFEYIQDKLGLGWGQDVMEVYSHTFSRMSGCGGGLEFTETTLGDLKAALHAGSTAPLAQSLWQCEGSYDPETCNQASVGCSGTPGWLGIGSTLFCFPPSESGTAPVAEEITADGITFSCLGIAPEITAPNALNVSLGPETNSATVTWNNDSVTDVNDTEFAIAGYNIYLGPDWDNPVGFVSAAGSTCSFKLTNLSLTQKYEVAVRAKDARWNLGYMTDKKQFALSGPMTKINIGDPEYLSYITASTPITFAVYDVYSNQIPATTYYSLDNPGSWTTVSGPVFIPDSGSHDIYFYSFYQGVDEQPGHCQVFVDNVAPETSLIAGEVLDTKDKWQDSVKENVFLDEQGKIRLTPDEQYASKTDQNASGSGDWCETITDSLQKLAQSFKPTV